MVVLQRGMNMMRMAGLAAAFVVAAMHATQAQAAAAADSVGPNGVTAVAIKSGRLTLSSAANPGPVVLPDGAYKGDGGTTLVILDGRLTRVEYASGTVVDVASVRVRDQRVIVTPGTTALVQVTPFPLPSGTFANQNGGASIKVVSGRPTEFSMGAPPSQP
jgi:hypothetical protein